MDGETNVIRVNFKKTDQAAHSAQTFPQEMAENDIESYVSIAIDKEGGIHTRIDYGDNFTKTLGALETLKYSILEGIRDSDA